MTTEHVPLTLEGNINQLVAELPQTVKDAFFDDAAINKIDLASTTVDHASTLELAIVKLNADMPQFEYAVAGSEMARMTQTMRSLRGVMSSNNFEVSTQNAGAVLTVDALTERMLAAAKGVKHGRQADFYLTANEYSALATALQNKMPGGLTTAKIIATIQFCYAEITVNIANDKATIRRLGVIAQQIRNAAAERIAIEAAAAAKAAAESNTEGNAEDVEAKLPRKTRKRSSNA